jgi:uncharacterized OsmC-like protein
MTRTATRTLNQVDLASIGDLVDKIRREPQRAKTQWKAEVRWTGGFRSDSRCRDFAPVQSDEPAGLGGTNTAPNPVEQLLAALGNCLAVGYAANASAAGIEIRSLQIDLEGGIDLRAFLGLGGDNAGYESIRVGVRLDADATPEQIQALHQKVVGSSPVGQTLSRGVPLTIELEPRRSPSPGA